MLLRSMLAVCLLLAPHALAQDDEDEDDAEEEEEKPAKREIRPLVPEEIKGQGYKLRVGREEYSLDKDRVTLPRGGGPKDLELVDPSGRILDTNSDYVDRYIFEGLDAHRFRVGLTFGGVDVEGEAFGRKLLQDQDADESTLDFYWLPSKLGVHVSSVSLSSTEEKVAGVDSRFESSQLRLGAAYETPVFRGHKGYFRRLHALAAAGALQGRHTIEIGDGRTAISDSDVGYGGFASLELNLPWQSFWFGARYALAYQSISFEKLDYESDFVTRSLSFGAYYGF